MAALSLFIVARMCSCRCRARRLNSKCWKFDFRLWMNDFYETTVHICWAMQWKELARLWNMSTASNFNNSLGSKSFKLTIKWLRVRKRGKWNGMSWLLFFIAWKQHNHDEYRSKRKKGGGGERERVNHKSNRIIVVRTITLTKIHNQLLNMMKIPFDSFHIIPFSLFRCCWWWCCCLFTVQAIFTLP